MKREKRTSNNRFHNRYWGMALLMMLLSSPIYAQYYENPYQMDQNGYPQGYQDYYPGQAPPSDLQYDRRDAERILQEQVSRVREANQQHAYPGYQQQPGATSDNYGHRIHDEGQVQTVMAEARRIASYVTSRNGKPFFIVDKRNFQFYLFDRNGRLLRVGPVAIGKGKTQVGAFESPVGIFPIRSKVPVADWVRPDWYFIEEGEPIPKKHEDRRVPGFFRYKLVYDGARYVHYAEATGGRLTHGCLGLDWQDAEAVFHTMQVGSYCIIVDEPFIARLARGEFPLPKPAAPKKPDETLQALDPKPRTDRKPLVTENTLDPEDKKFGSLW